MGSILEKLKGGDLRSIGRADEVVESVLRNPKLFGEVFEGMMNNDPVVRMRAADVVEKVSGEHPEYLRPFKKRLIDDVAKISQQEVRWHVAQMFSYLRLNASERSKVASILFSWIDSGDKSRIVKVMSLQTLAEFAKQDDKLREKVVAKLREVVRTGSPAMKTRSRKLLKGLAHRE